MHAGHDKLGPGPGRAGAVWGVGVGGSAPPRAVRGPRDVASGLEPANLKNDSAQPPGRHTRDSLGAVAAPGGALPHATEADGDRGCPQRGCDQGHLDRAGTRVTTVTDAIHTPPRRTRHALCGCWLPWAQPAIW